MSEITKLEKKGKDPDRLVLHLDGKFYCTIDALVAAKHTLFVGKEVDQDALDKIVLESDRQRAFDYALDYISRYPSTERNVSRKLYDKGFGRVVVEGTIAKLTSYGYLDDAEYARAYVEINGKVKGAKRLQADLKAKGVSADVIADALKGFEGYDAALELARKHSRGKDLEDQGYVDKLARYLLYRGYGWDDVSHCIAALKREREDQDDPS